MFFGHSQPGAFTEEHERVAAGIATQAGIAVEKARLLAAERDARSVAEARADAAVALDLVDDVVVLVDRDGFVRLWNGAAATIVGLDARCRPCGTAGCRRRPSQAARHRRRGVRAAHCARRRHPADEPDRRR